MICSRSRLFSACRGSKSSVARSISSTLQDNDVVCVSLARSPIARFGGSFASLTAPKLGAQVLEAALARGNVAKESVEEVYLGNVVSAGVGQAPTRQAVIYAGLGLDTPCTTINKVCASGMKAAMMAAQAIGSGYRGTMVAGGMESMSNIPYYLPGARTGYRMGDHKAVDGMVHDGLWDVYNNQHMGMCGEKCSVDYDISRADQDAFSIASYERAAAAWAAGKFDFEVCPVTVPGKRGKPDTVISVDEEFTNVDVSKLASLRPAFKKDGVITAANASKLNDGASALVLMSAAAAREGGHTPLFKISGFGDAGRDPVEFTVAPADAVPRALKNAGMAASDVEYHEINEAFAVVALANARLLDIDLERLNVFGGAVALGHPIGSSGSRILCTLYSVLKDRDATVGCASICNGGGGASAVVIERLS